MAHIEYHPPTWEDLKKRSDFWTSVGTTTSFLVVGALTIGAIGFIASVVFIIWVIVSVFG